MNNYCYLFAFLLLLGCHFEEEVFQAQPEGLQGTWKLVESAASDGVNMNVTPVSNGQEIVFLANETFVVHLGNDCDGGFYYYTGDRLTLDNLCKNDGTVVHSVVYSVQFEKDYMVLVPLDPMCIEGCWLKYKKLKK